ncbi:hypothetical protein, conserved in T. vivax [Trypanosoma vivax Y486]|uniref:Uncharacterized protein n=1 Tax=Trypanosoma vivax (strain Y486) TaxID=1055687 RepID=F9WU99_TRYVY|nr:hypothetical protein, conserved in T. vivax [Trypanosoma vivax Y486]|eukprot:CCD21147.1 hypothetical protein, conserved in T. vivax [Trypanosoma vivax Y486]
MRVRLALLFCACAIGIAARGAAANGVGKAISFESVQAACRGAVVMQAAATAASNMAATARERAKNAANWHSEVLRRGADSVGEQALNVTRAAANDMQKAQELQALAVDAQALSAYALRVEDFIRTFASVSGGYDTAYTNVKLCIAKGASGGTNDESGGVDTGDQDYLFGQANKLPCGLPDAEETQTQLAGEIMKTGAVTTPKWKDTHGTLKEQATQGKGLAVYGGSGHALNSGSAKACPLTVYRAYATGTGGGIIDGGSSHKARPVQWAGQWTMTPGSQNGERGPTSHGSTSFAAIQEAFTDIEQRANKVTQIRQELNALAQMCSVNGYDICEPLSATARQDILEEAEKQRALRTQKRNATRAQTGKADTKNDHTREGKVTQEGSDAETKLDTNTVGDTHPTIAQQGARQLCVAHSAAILCATAHLLAQHL